MPKQEAPLDYLRRFIPEPAVVKVLDYLRLYNVHLTITQERKTVLGDYRHATGYRAPVQMPQVVVVERGAEEGDRAVAFDRLVTREELPEMLARHRNGGNGIAPILPERPVRPAGCARN